MKNISKISEKIANYFSSTANFYVKQVEDGSYRKTPGRVTSQLIESIINNKQSIACYQRNIDHTINWICFDFDILKSKIKTAEEGFCESHLLEVAKNFSDFLSLKNINHLIEFSGNRGIHIWINFEIPIYPYIAYELVKKLIDDSEISINRSIIGLDLFPSSPSHKSTFGKAVKIPLSKHTKSGLYSILLEKLPITFSEVHVQEISDQILENQLAILEGYSAESITEIEKKLNFEFEIREYEEYEFNQIRSIEIFEKTINFDELIHHWKKSQLTLGIASDIVNGELNHARRQLLVGVFKAVVNRHGDKIGNSILLEIFSKMNNFDREKTEAALSRLEHLRFPDQELVEAICNFTLAKRIPITELAEMFVPHFRRIDDGLFKVRDIDLRVLKIAESNYIYQNDEVRCIKVIDDIATIDFNILKSRFEDLNLIISEIDIYRHFRLEKNKEKPRELVTLGAEARLFSTWAMKYLNFIFGNQVSENSFGYQINPNFSGGHIFKPWLYQWIQFLHDIGDFLNNELNSGFFVVKTDIKSFYDSIPQDNLERLLLLGFNEAISANISSISPESSEKYKLVAQCLINIIRKSNPDRRGVPQGPAYVRYLCELYLIQVDELMDGLLEGGEILFYHRYVDDIFFVADTESNAEKIFAQLRSKLALLGLNLNPEKTTISQIRSFSSEFDKYRAQAKYAIDAISSNIEDSTDHEKNVAILEYNKLISQQEENDDAVFLFSHLPGVSFADRYRNDAVIPILKSGLGRGNLFKHVFIYVLNNESLWHKFEEIEIFTALQSEVLTSVCVELLSDQRDATKEIQEFIVSQITKLTTTVAVSEHLAYLKLYFGIHNEDFGIYAVHLLDCIRKAEEPERIQVNGNLLDMIQSELNGVPDLGLLCDYLFPLCIKSCIDVVSLDALSKIFVAKISSDDGRSNLNLINCGENIKLPITAKKYYQLLCLFTLSDAFNTRDLLEAAWEFCARIFSIDSEPPADFRKMYWYRNFDLVSVNKINLNIVASSISQGAIWNGIADIHGIYAHYHNALMIVMLTGEKNENLIDLRAVISKLKNVGKFYQWLFSDNVNLFPSKEWFIENVSKNDCILLRRDNAILVRKASHAFMTKDAEIDNFSSALSGYSDYIIKYEGDEHVSISNFLLGSGGFFDILQRTCLVLETYAKDLNALPNIFATESLVNLDNKLPFTEEVRGQPYLIFEQSKEVNSKKNNFKNFLECVFLVMRSDSSHAFDGKISKMTLWNFYSTYLSVLDAETEVIPFLRQFSIFANGAVTPSIEVVFDLTISAALYGIYVDADTVNPLITIKRFLEKYNRMNKTFSTRHIYMPSLENVPSKKNLDEFCNSIMLALNGAANYRLDLRSQLSLDLKEYFAVILNMAKDILPDITLMDFDAKIVALNVVTETISVGGESFTYENVVVINPVNGLNQSFIQEHIYLTQISEDIFGFKAGEKAFIFFVPREITLCYSDCQSRYNKYYKDGIVVQGQDFPYLDHKTGIENFDLNRASIVVSKHRNISVPDAELRLRQWLSHLPIAARHPLILLIQAHETMSLEAVAGISGQFDSLRTNKNPFLIKRFRDFGGIHRILAVDAERARHLDEHGPDSLQENSIEASLFLDVTVSGGQISEAIDYYLSLKIDAIDKHYFGDDEKKRIAIGNKLRNLKKLNIFSVLYTQKSKTAIQESFKAYGLDVEISFIMGTDISENALFETTKNITSKNKLILQKFFADEPLMNQLMKVVFSMNKSTRKYLQSKIEKSGKINLVTRYHSVTKKCLDFLTCDIKGYENSSIFERVREKSEM